ncbi:DNA polymerase III subunit delta [Hespellia stercorisuis]|uniref:DNA polymerase III subunit delta n=1 Tax=Hespellia stercorisuis DSM 15480 TaxID=1121950 RepID=A0A1M6RVV5_9FIRM|nr:DNA polymerase III subunit delta [Hespellia stercorisuis]SHK36580.1 DNA polymerase III, delta subunit [Hespellia stercorisuis DSM 15480]
MKSLNEDLKTGQFKQIYLLYGEENYLKKQYKEKLSKAMLADGDTMNYAYYEGKGVDVREVIDLAETLPFFAERRVIVFENTGFFKNAAPELADYIEGMSETTSFLFVENEIDKRGRLYKAVKKYGRIVEMSSQDENTLKRWILGAVKKENKQISDRTLTHFLSLVGTDMENIQKELEKLFCYTLEKESITEADVDEICITQMSNQIFDMINAVADKRQKRALDLYYDLLALKEPPMRILYLMARQFRLLLQVKDLQKKGFGRKDIASKAGLHPFAAGKYMEQEKHFKKQELRAILEDCADTEERVKTGRLGDTLAVELFIVKYSMA